MSADYVIVGAGSAGCVLANRLSADPANNVVLVEAGGPDSSFWIHLPAGSRNVVGNPATDWCYQSEPEPGLGGRQGPVVRGKVLGGSSSINGTVYTRGVASDYDHWRQLGLTGWSWDDVLPCFRAIEHWRHGPPDEACQGELHIERPELSMPIFDILSEAARQAGLRQTPGFNSGDPEGFGTYDVTQRFGIRQSSAAAFLKPVRGRSNLEVVTRAHCLGLTFEGRRATGVRLRLDDGSDRVISARREVILCAGAIGSPQILQLSGIGPGQVLQDAGVPVLLDRDGVGGGLQDHVSMRVAWRIHGVATINSRYSNLFKRALIGLEYALLRRGPAIMPGPLWGGYFKTDPLLEEANVQMFVMPATFSGTTSFTKLDSFDGLSAGTYHMHPRSRGRVWIRSSDPMEAPSILHNYLQDPYDRQVALASLKLSRHWAVQPAFQALRPEELRPGSQFQSDEDLMQQASQQCGTAYHQVGTCAMGATENSVLDERMRVRGIDGLRVVDGSAMPKLISGNTSGPIMMMAHKASMMIRDDNW